MRHTMIAIDNGQDIIDSRDIIARIAELESFLKEMREFKQASRDIQTLFAGGRS